MATVTTRVNLATNPALTTVPGAGTNWLSGAALNRVSFGGKWWLQAPGDTYLYAGGSGSVGSYYAVSCRLNGTPGDVVQVVSTDNVWGSFTDTPGVTIPPSGEVVVRLKSTVASSGTTLSFGVITTPGQSVKVTEALLEQVSGPGLYPGEYFDGSFAAKSVETYSPPAAATYQWVGVGDGAMSHETITIPLQDYQVELPDGTITGAKTSVGLLEILGLRGSGDTRNTDYDRSGVDGMSPGISLLTGRTLQVKWLVVDRLAAEAALQNLTRNWQNTNNPASLAMSARDYLVEVATAGTRKTSALKIQLPGRGLPFIVFGKPGRLDPPVNSSYQHGWIEVGSEWQNLDGKVYDDTVHVAETTLPSSSGGAPFPWTFPANFGPSTGGTLFVENDGLYPAKPVYKITGPIINPRVIESSTGKFVRINLTLIAGDVLIVDTDSRVVRLNGVNRNNALDVNSSIFSIPPGGTSLAFSSTDAGGSTYGSLSVYTMNTYSAA